MSLVLLECLSLLRGYPTGPVAGIRHDDLLFRICAGLGIGLMGRMTAHQSAGIVALITLPKETFSHSWLVIAPDAYRRPVIKALAAFLIPRLRRAREVAFLPNRR